MSITIEVILGSLKLYLHAILALNLNLILESY